MPEPRFRRPAISVLSIVVSAISLTLIAVWFFAGDLMHFQAAAERGPEKIPAVPSRDKAPISSHAMQASKYDMAEAAPKRARSNAVKARSTKPDTSPEAVSPPAPILLEPRLPQFPPQIPPIAPEITSSDRAIRERAVDLDGVWVYATRQPRAREPRLYLPEYIELRLRTEDNVLHGRYASRYSVPDRAISPQVVFAFEGRAGGNNEYEWRSPDGSRGIVDLKPITAESMQVDWRIAEFGARIGLGAGTAVLIRRSAR